MEIWKTIKDFPNYEISNCGNVRNRITGKRLKKQIKEKGYLGVILHKDKKKYNLRVHRIVAMEFVENHKNKPYVNHINGDKKDNNSCNLEWVTPSENNIHAVKNNLMTFETLYVPIILVDILTLEKKEFKSISECEKIIGSTGLSFTTSKKQVFAKKYLPFYKSEFNENDLSERLKNTNANKVLDIESNTISEFYTITQAANFIKKDARYVSNAIVRNTKIANKYIVKKKWN